MMLLDSVVRRLGSDVGVDLGTANTLVFVRERGIVIREPSVIARLSDHGQILAVGEEAKRMIGRTPSDIVATRPLRNGVIADFDTTARMLTYFIRKSVGQRSLLRPRVLVAIPWGATRVEKRAVIEAAEQAGARQALLIEQPLAAAIGANLPIAEPVGNLVVDIGGGTTEIALIALGGIVTAKSIRVGGYEMDESIIQYCRRAYNLVIGERTAEDAKISLGSAYPLDGDQRIEVRGRDVVNGLPRSLQVKSSELREALAEPVSKIMQAVKQTLELVPPELAADIADRGITMVGGGSLLRGIDHLLTEETGMPVSVSGDPLSAVALGTGKVFEDVGPLRRLAFTSRAL